MWQAIWLPKLATILLALSSKSDICSLLHFGCFSREGTNSRPSFSLELFLITVLFKIGPSREKQQFLPSAIYICRKFQIAYYTNICWSEEDIFLLAKMRQRHFFIACQAVWEMTDKATGYPIPVGRSYKLPKWSLTGALTALWSLNYSAAVVFQHYTKSTINNSLFLPLTDKIGLYRTPWDRKMIFNSSGVVTCKANLTNWSKFRGVSSTLIEEGGDYGSSFPRNVIVSLPWRYMWGLTN